jgi:Zn-dependent protease with chaperone function
MSLPSMAAQLTTPGQIACQAGKFRHLVVAALLVAGTALSGCASTTAPGTVGVSRSQLLLVSAETVERFAAQNYMEQGQTALAKRKLITGGDQYNRLSRITERLRAQVPAFRNDTGSWKWELQFIDSPSVNATCAPGGKITVYSGLVHKLKLDDDELAAVIGHEIAHALREHGRERISEAVAAGALTVAAIAKSNRRNMDVHATLTSDASKFLFQLPHSREREYEADKIGLELAARAGYDPVSAITLWRKFSAFSKDDQVELLATHPSNKRRIDALWDLLPVVIPLYQAAPKAGAMLADRSPES